MTQTKASEYTQQADGSWKLTGESPLQPPYKKDIILNCPSQVGAGSNRDKSVTESVTETGLSERVLDWVRHTRGWWDVTELDNECHILVTPDKENRRKILERLRNGVTPVIERHPTINKRYRYIDVAIDRLDFKTKGKKITLDLEYPFGVEKYFNTYPKNLIVVAGAKDAGKTALAIDFIRRNQDKHLIYYFCSEMGEDELQGRLELVEGVKLDDWKFEAIARSENFADVIVPDAINIIDFLEISENFFLIAQQLRAIHNKLTTGIAIVLIQKAENIHLGTGGRFSAERARLYLSIDNGKFRIVYSKNWKTLSINPRGMTACFNIEAGNKFNITKELSHWEAEKGEL